MFVKNSCMWENSDDNKSIVGKWFVIGSKRIKICF